MSGVTAIQCTRGKAYFSATYEELKAMTTPLWVLLAFAVWTLAVLMIGIGVRRWTLIFSGRAQLTDFPADSAHGSTAYRRAVRAHANCVENLPVFGAIAVTAYVAKVTEPAVDLASIVFMATRMFQSLTHMLLTETNTTVLLRFIFFLAQVVVMIYIAAEVATYA